MNVLSNVPPPPFVRYPASNVTSAAGGLTLTGGFASSAEVAAKEVFPMEAGQGFLLAILGGGADNDTIDFRVYLVHYTYGTDGQQTGSYRVFFGSGTATLGTGATIGGTAAAAGLRVADTITWAQATTSTTPKGIGGVLETAYGSVGTAAYSPADNTAALIVCPQTGWANGIIVELDPTGTTTDAFCMIARK